MAVINGVDYNLASRTIPADGKLVAMAEHFDEFIVDYQLKHPSVWRDRIPKGQMPLFNGFSQKTYNFRGALGPQAGLTDWTRVEPSRKPAGSDLGYDRCSYTPQTYSWAFTSAENVGYATSWRSPVFCVNELKFVDAAKQQLAYIIRAGAQITDQVKETFNREIYVKTAADAGRCVVLCDGGGVNYVDSSSYRFSYDPFTKDSSSNTYITFPKALLPKISSLNWNQLDLIRQYLADECPDAAMGMDSGMPVFGLMVDLNDFERFVLGDSDLREDFRYAKPQQLISGFNMGFKVYRGFALIHDQRQMRFSIQKNDATNITAIRVKPRRDTTAGIIGGVPECNPAYITAELGTAIVFLSDSIMIQVPPTVTNLGSGMVFSPQPGFNGEWTWLNIADAETNPLNENGYFFSRYEYFVKPLQYSEDIHVFLYRRCPHSLATGCAIEDDEDASLGPLSPTVAVASADFDATNLTVVLTLSKKLAANLGDAVSIKKDDGNSFAANIVSDQKAPTYTFAWATGATNAPSAYTDMNDLTIVTVTVS